MYFSLRLWGYTKGVRLRIAAAVAFGLLTAAAGIARLAMLGWLLGEVFDGEGLRAFTSPNLSAANNSRCVFRPEHPPGE